MDGWLFLKGESGESRTINLDCVEEVYVEDGFFDSEEWFVTARFPSGHKVTLYKGSREGAQQFLERLSETLAARPASLLGKRG
jgi:hypothetical protein